MTDNSSASPVIVGIDGSDTAIHAAEWAVDEAVNRGVPLRLVYVAKATHLGSEEYYEDIHRGKASLETARAAVEASGKQVRIETKMLEGLPGTTLVAASWDAGLVCVGSVGIGRYAQAILGSTATELAEAAHCPVAIIRPQSGTHRKDINWIVVAANQQPGNDAVVEQAMREASLRHAPVLLLGDRESADGAVDRLEHEIVSWKRRYPDVHIYPVANAADVAHFLKHHDERVQLAVIGAADAGELADIVGPTGHPVFHHADSSALVVHS
ncbi:MAG: universal stress protein [Ilumatobacteraceae bacterium]